jgi:hypothetical protein
MNDVKRTVIRSAYFILFLSILSCQNGRKKNDALLANIDLLRGDVVLCGSGQFGDVRFSSAWRPSYEKDLKVHPNRLNGIYGAAVAANSAGDKTKAIQYFTRLLEITDGVNSDRKELAEAKAFLYHEK